MLRMPLAGAGTRRSSSSLLLSSLELIDTQVYEPYTRALLGTASHFCEGRGGAGVRLKTSLRNIYR